ncbi:MAG: hypothetical protein U0X20_24205 [Caldilineaceae bacterium]
MKAVYILQFVVLVLAVAAAPRGAAAAATVTPTATLTMTPTVTPTLTPWVVTATPQPTDVLAAATAKAARERGAATTGTPTPMPKNMVVATATVTPRVATLTPTPANGATATLQAQQATAVAFTTGTPFVVTPTPLSPPTATPTAIVVTPTPQPLDVFAAATRKVEQATRIAAEGTPTLLPRTMVVATVTPAPRVVTATATPGNAATAVYQEAFATAVAFTTGMPPLITATPTATVPPPPPAAKPLPPTATPIAISLAALTATPLPTATPVLASALVGKILFQAAFPNPKATAFMVMDPDGANPSVLGGRSFYDQAELRDATTAAGAYAYAEQENGPNQGGLTQIWVYDKASNSRRPWTKFGAGTAWWPAWSPGGNRIAFTSNEPGNDEIFVMAKDQWPPTRLTGNDWEWDHHPTWSPDGRQIVFASNRSGKRQLWIMNADGSNQRRLTDFPFEVWNPVWVK